LTTATSNPAAAIDPQALLRQLAPYRQPQTARSAFEVAVTAIPFILLWALTCLAVQAGYYLGLLLALPAGAFLTRLFLIQHDCGHGAFFRSRKANDWVGRVLGVFTLTPYDYWRRSHAAHHAGTGNLDARGLGDLDTLTIAEFRARGPVARFLYRLYRSPIVLFGIGPAYVFFLKHRWPAGMMKQGWRPWLSPMGTNLAIAAAACAMSWLVGFQVFLIVHVPIVLVAATLGVWLFYVQHQFEDTVWDTHDEWSFHTAAVHGSSYYELPTVLRWVTANIGIHHVHHLASRIPFYRLNDALRDFQDLATINRIGILDSLRLVRLALWDEKNRRMVSFREAKALAA
jgi:omega-6 fatty acid desaturase (delta-12 desaturase)